MEYTYHERFAEHVRLIKDMKIALDFLKRTVTRHKVYYIQGSTGIIRVEYNVMFNGFASSVTVGSSSDKYGSAVLLDEHSRVRQLYIKRNRYDDVKNSIMFHMDNIKTSLKAVLLEHDAQYERNDTLELSVELPLHENIEENQFNALLQNANDITVLVLYALELFMSHEEHP